MEPARATNLGTKTMKTFKTFAAASAVIGALVFASSIASADVTVKKAMAMPLDDTTKPGAVMLVIESDAADRLTGIQTPAAGIAQVHNNKEKAGKMRMRRTEAFDIPAGTTTMAHDGTHIMLMQVGAPLSPGAEFPLTLTFEKGGTVEVMVKVMGG